MADKLYAARDTTTGKLVSDITNPRRKYWDNEPFLLDDELRKKATRWVEWANNADPSEYDPLAQITEETP